MTTTERPERSVPKPVFTDAEAGAREFPDSSAGARRYNYFSPAKRKQTHYEDVTVEVCSPTRDTTCPRDGSTASPTARPATPALDRFKAWGPTLRPEPRRGPGTGGPARPELAGARLARVPRPQRGGEQTLYRYNANVVRQLTQNVDNARNSKAFSLWAANWVHFVERHVGAWMHIEHILGSTSSPRTSVWPDEHAQPPSRWPPTAPERSGSPRT